MKKEYMFLIASAALNLILITLFIIGFNPFARKQSYFGLYQTTYYNNYNKQVILTIRLNNDYTCTYGEFAAEYAGEGSDDCKYTVDGKNITLTRYFSSGYEDVKSGQLLDSGILFISGKQLSKID